jgi:hypothetical protein
VGLELGSLSLVSTIEELLGRNSGSGLENRVYGRGDTLRLTRDTLYPQKLTLTSPTSGDRSIGIVRLRAKDTEFFYGAYNITLLSDYPPLISESYEITLSSLCLCIPAILLCLRDL